jgi:serine/threonine protein kinase
MTDLTGQSISRYNILERLGKGGMATVYKAFDTRLERHVAVKIIHSSAFPSEQLELILKRFEREAKTFAKLSHPNIVGIIDYGEYEGSPYLVMEFLPSGTLTQGLGTPIPWPEAVRLLLPTAPCNSPTNRGPSAATSNPTISSSASPASRCRPIMELRKSWQTRRSPI